MSLTVVFRETALRNLARIRSEDKDLFLRTRRAIASLADQPYPEGALAWSSTTRCSGFCSAPRSSRWPWRSCTTTSSCSRSGLGVLISWVSGGNTLAMELQDPVVFGLFGIACLVSIAVGRPLHQVILRAMGRSNPRCTQAADRAAASGTSMVSTAIIGLACLGHAVAVAVLALTQTTSTFLALQNPVGLPFLGLGVAGLFLYGTRQQARQSAAAAIPPARDVQPGDDQAETMP